MLWLIVWLCTLSIVVSVRVLVVFPVPDQSHSILGDSIVKTLLTGNEYIHLNSLPSPRSALADHQKLLGSEYVRQVLQHEAVQRLMMDPAVTFDVVIADWFHTELFECPLVWYTAGDMSWQALKLVHEVPSAAYQTGFGAEAPSAAIQERSRRLWNKLQLAFWSYYYTNHIEIPMYEAVYRIPLQMRGRSLPDYESLVYNGSLLLVNSHPPLAQPLPMPQNAKHVGGHHLDLPVKPLPKNLQTFLDKAQNGVIYVNFGPNLRSRDIPQTILQQLLQLFSQLEQTVLWKLEGAVDFVPRNVLVLERTPQLGILSHYNTVLFVTDGSSTSMVDTTYCGVPVIGIPFLTDQIRNVDWVVTQGYAKRVDFTQFVAWKLQEAIGQIIGNHSYNLNAKQASATFKQRLLPTKAELLHWLHLVVATGGAPHLRSPAVDLATFERYHLDICLLILMLFWFLSKVIKVIQVHLKDDEDDKKVN